MYRIWIYSVCPLFINALLFECFKKQTTVTEGKLSSFHKLQYRNMYHFFRGHLIINCYLSIFPSYFNLDVNIDLAIFLKFLFR